MVSMDKKSLNKKKQGPEFAKGIELRSFADLSRLSDHDLDLLYRKTERWNLGAALSAADDETAVLKERILKVLPESERQLLKIEIAHGMHQDPFHAIKQKVVGTARRMQGSGRHMPKQRTPHGTVEVQSFDDIGLLASCEIQMMLRQIDTVDFAQALMGQKAEREKADIWAKANVSHRVWGFIELERKHRKVTPSQVRAAQKKILDIIRELQWERVIRPGKNQKVRSDRVGLKTFGDLADLTDKEMQTTLCETESKDLAVAFKGKGKAVRDVEKWVYRNVSERVQNLIKAHMDEISPSQSEIRKAQETILKNARNLQILGFLRPGQRRPTKQQYALIVDEVARVRIERKQHSDAWTPRGAALRVLMPFVAKIIQNGGSQDVSDILGNVEDPVLREGLRLLSQGGTRDDFEKALQHAVQREFTRVAKHTEAVFEGLLAVHDGEEPRKIAELLSEL